MTEEPQPIKPLETPEPIKTEETKIQQETQEPDLLELDPLTMNCNDMPDMMKKLTKKMMTLETSIQQIKQLQEVFPKKKTLKRLENEATKQQEQIESKIAQITERYSACRPQ
jgi:formyltetrahydrofolate hydrolase